MKKKIIFLAVLVCVFICMCAFVGCDKKCSTHEFSFGKVTWDKEGKSFVTLVCAVCGETISEEADVAEKITKEATCTEEGEKIITATVQIGGNSLNHFEQKTVLPATEHKYSAVTYSWNRDHSECEAKKTCSVCHDTVRENAKSTSSIARVATCSLAGEKQYTVKFQNKEFGTKTYSEEIEKLPHTYNGEISYAWKNHVCTATRTCTVCKEQDKESVQGVYSVVQDKDCHIDGIGRYTANFRMASAVPQTEEVVIPMGHDYNYDDVTYMWDDSHSECTATVYCVRGDDMKELNGSVTKTKEDETCVKDGKITYVAKFDDNNIENATYVQIIPNKGGHRYGTVQYNWSADNRSCTAQKECGVCHEVFDERATITLEVVKEPTCTEKGERKITATFKNAEFSTREKTEEIPAKGHVSGRVEIEWSQDHTSCTGKEYCSECDEFIEEITLNGSYIEEKVRVEKGCETDGERTFTAIFRFNDGTVKISVESEAIPASHEYGEITYEYKWENEKLICKAQKICLVCGGVVSETQIGEFRFMREENGKLFIQYIVTFKNEEFGKKTFEIEVNKINNE